jgi:hypothetical protein
LLNGYAMRRELTAETLARLILWGLDQAMAGQPRPLRLRAAPAPDGPLVATLDYVAGFPCITITPLVKFQQRYQNSHRIFRNLLLLKAFRPSCGSQTWRGFSRPILGA